MKLFSSLSNFFGLGAKLTMYPTSRDYSFDSVTFDIIKQLEKKRFKVHGFMVDFASLKHEQYCYVREIKGGDFKLIFSRLQGKHDFSSYDIAGVSELRIPGKIIEVYGEFSKLSSPVFYEYTGSDWMLDKDKDPYSCKDLFRLYVGSSVQDASGIDENVGGLKPYLVESVSAGVPKFLETSKVMQEFKDFLEIKLRQIK